MHRVQHKYDTLYNNVQNCMQAKHRKQQVSWFPIQVFLLISKWIHIWVLKIVSSYMWHENILLFWTAGLSLPHNQWFGYNLVHCILHTCITANNSQEPQVCVGIVQHIN